MKHTFSILVNTTDKFEDCWHPFFTLFAKYWPDYTGTIYLNTEYKEFTYPGLNIVSVKNCINNPKDTKTWSECLADALKSIDSEVVLYMQEDYFLKAPVQHVLVEKYAQLVAGKGIDCIHLTDQNSAGPFSPSTVEDLWLLDQQATDRISCQAALWKKSVLMSYIRTYENPWLFEWYGTRRAHLTKHAFYNVNREVYKLNQNEIIPYVFTGVIGGRWFEEVVGLFAEHDIPMDFSKRGFYKDAKPKTLKDRLKKRRVNFTMEFHSILELMAMKTGIPYKNSGIVKLQTTGTKLVAAPNYGKQQFVPKVKRKLNSMFVEKVENTFLQFRGYASYWHYVFSNKTKTVESKPAAHHYITQMVDPGAGIGHQLANWNTGLYFAGYYHLKYAYSPFSTEKWDSFLGFGEGEVSASELKNNKEYKVVRLPRFDSTKQEQIDLVGKIIASYTEPKIIFYLEMNQGYMRQCDTSLILSNKFFNASARKKETLVFDPEVFNIAIHIRRRMKVETPEVWKERGLDNSYFKNVLTEVLTILPKDLKRHIYLFSQGTKEEFPEFDNIEHLTFCLDMGPVESVLHMIHADLLISSKSSFSYKPALISKGIQIAPKTFWHEYPDTENFILADNDGRFNVEKLKIAINEQ